MTYRTCGLAPGLEELVEVARQGQVTAAADVLGTPQPTLSRAIARLSTAVGSPLVERRGRGIRLTHHGRLLAAYAERALTEINAGLDRIHAETDPDVGTVRLGFLNSMGPSLVPELLHGFSRVKPRVTVRLVQHGTAELLTAVADGELDLCIAGVAPDPADPDPGAGLRRRVLATEPLALLVPDGHPLIGPAPVAVERLHAEAIVTMQPGYGLRTVTDQLLDAARRPPRYVFESQDIPTCVGLVRAGLGVTVVPATTRTPGTTVVAIDSPLARRTIEVFWARHRPLTPAAGDLLDHVTAAAPGLLVGSPGG